LVLKIFLENIFTFVLAVAMAQGPLVTIEVRREGGACPRGSI